MLVASSQPEPPLSLSLPQDEEDAKESHDDDDRVQLTSAIMSIVARLDNDCKHVSQVNKSQIPASLQYLLAVELSTTTFSTLLSLVEDLAANYYSFQQFPPVVVTYVEEEEDDEEEEKKKEKESKNRGREKQGMTSSSKTKKTKKMKKEVSPKQRRAELRMMAFLVCLRLLRINLEHLVEWNVDPKECGFAEEEASLSHSSLPAVSPPPPRCLTPSLPCLPSP